LLRNREKRKIENEEFWKIKFLKIGGVLLGLGMIISVLIYFGGLEKELFVLGGGLAVFGLIHLLAYRYIAQGRSYLGMVSMVKDFNSMPKTMIQLAYVQFFSWFALFAMWIYTTPAVTSFIYHTTVTRS